MIDLDLSFIMHLMFRLRHCELTKKKMGVGVGAGTGFITTTSFVPAYSYLPYTLFCLSLVSFI